MIVLVVVGNHWDLWVLGFVTETEIDYALELALELTFVDLASVALAFVDLASVALAFLRLSSAGLVSAALNSAALNSAALGFAALGSVTLGSAGLPFAEVGSDFETETWELVTDFEVEMQELLLDIAVASVVAEAVILAAVSGKVQHVNETFFCEDTHMMWFIFQSTRSLTCLTCISGNVSLEIFFIVNVLDDLSKTLSRS